LCERNAFGRHAILKRRRHVTVAVATDGRRLLLIRHQQDDVRAIGIGHEWNSIYGLPPANANQVKVPDGFACYSSLVSDILHPHKTYNASFRRTDIAAKGGKQENGHDEAIGARVKQ
jgi:hypothetical protein